jgi:hypothetical protein
MFEKSEQGNFPPFFKGGRPIFQTSSENKKRLREFFPEGISEIVYAAGRRSVNRHDMQK